MLNLFLALALFSWTDHKDGRVELTENGKSVLTYNYGPQLKNNAPEDRRACCYIYPALTPAGVSPLDDFPKDHFHHHGLFWAWPVVKTPDAKYDLWMYKGIQHRGEKFTARDSNLIAENGWYAGETKLVKETLRLTAHPANGKSRDLDIELTLEAVSVPITLEGSAEKGKSYGGLSARFAPRTETAITADTGPVAKDEDLVFHKWAEMRALYDGKPATLRITAESPTQWCLRNYGFVGSSWPGRDGATQSFTLQPGKPLKLKYRVSLSD